MKYLTIRARVTLWYTFFMAALAAVTMGVLIMFSENYFSSDQKADLIEAVQDAAEDLAEGESPEYFEDNVYLMWYDENQAFVEGAVPSGFSESTALSDTGIQTMTGNGQTFYVYDLQITTYNSGNFWIRGVVSGVESSSLHRFLIRTALILLPILVILSSVIGYLITKRAFAPVRKIQETAKQITESGALSMRIGLPDQKDEIAQLGNTIDLMLEKLEQSFEKEKQFTSDASHELRTPAAVILTESEYFLAHGETMEEARESMEVVNRQANKISSLINQLLFFSRADRGTLQLRPEPVDVGRLVKELADDFQIIASEKSIEVETVLQFDEPGTEEQGIYRVDRTLFTRAVQNILQNAVSYGKENGHIWIHGYLETEYFVIEIKDDGIGIEEEYLDKIWDRFYQVDSARNNTGSGSMGLGLSMVKWIMEQHDGYADVKSKPEKGTTFILHFSKNL